MAKPYSVSSPTHHSPEVGQSAYGTRSTSRSGSQDTQATKASSVQLLRRSTPTYPSHTVSRPPARSLWSRRTRSAPACAAARSSASAGGTSHSPTLPAPPCVSAKPGCATRRTRRSRRSPSGRSPLGAWQGSCSSTAAVPPSRATTSESSATRRRAGPWTTSTTRPTSACSDPLTKSPAKVRRRLIRCPHRLTRNPCAVQGFLVQGRQDSNLQPPVLETRTCNPRFWRQRRDRAPAGTRSATAPLRGGPRDSPAR
jgi:hypothetical protein